MLAGLLIAGAVVLVATNIKEVREINIFAVVLVIQSLPFVAAVALAVIERTRLNDFAYWRALEARFAELAAAGAASPMRQAPATIVRSGASRSVSRCTSTSANSVHVMR